MIIVSHRLKSLILFWTVSTLWCSLTSMLYSRLEFVAELEWCFVLLLSYLGTSLDDDAVSIFMQYASFCCSVTSAPVWMMTLSVSSCSMLRSVAQLPRHQSGWWRCQYLHAVCFVLLLSYLGTSLDDDAVSIFMQYASFCFSVTSAPVWMMTLSVSSCSMLRSVAQLPRHQSGWWRCQYLHAVCFVLFLSYLGTSLDDDAVSIFMQYASFCCSVTSAPVWMMTLSVSSCSMLRSVSQLPRHQSGWWRCQYLHAVCFVLLLSYLGTSLDDDAFSIFMQYASFCCSVTSAPVWMMTLSVSSCSMLRSVSQLPRHQSGWWRCQYLHAVCCWWLDSESARSLRCTGWTSVPTLHGTDTVWRRTSARQQCHSQVGWLAVLCAIGKINITFCCH